MSSSFADFFVFKPRKCEVHIILRAYHIWIDKNVNLEVLLITIFLNRPEWLRETWLNKEIRISQRSIYLILYHCMQNKGLSESIFPKLLMEMADNTQERLTLELTNFKS